MDSQGHTRANCVFPDRFEGDGQIVNPGETIAKGIKTDSMVMVQSVETPEGKGLLLRSVEEFTIPDQAQLPELKHVKQPKGPSLGIKASQDQRTAGHGRDRRWRRNGLGSELACLAATILPRDLADQSS